MKIECAWCGKKLGEKPGPPDEISHGICKDCKEKLLKDSKKFKKDSA